MAQAKIIEQLQRRVDRLMGQIESLAGELAAVKVELASHEPQGQFGEDDTLVNEARVRGRIDYRDDQGLWCVYVDADEPQITCGRTPDNSITIPSPSVARRHFCVACELGRVWIRDLGTATGTYVNENPVGPTGRRLEDGDQIRCGAQQMTFLLEAHIGMAANG